MTSSPQTDQPETAARAMAAAALVLTHPFDRRAPRWKQEADGCVIVRTQLVPVQAIDFYRGQPS